MINLCNTLLPSDKVHAIPAVIGKRIKPIPVIDRVTEADVGAISTIVSSDSNFVLSILKIGYLFLDLLFLTLKYVIISLKLLG